MPSMMGAGVAVDLAMGALIIIENFGGGGLITWLLSFTFSLFRFSPPTCSPQYHEHHPHHRHPTSVNPKGPLGCTASLLSFSPHIHAGANSIMLCRDCLRSSASHLVPFSCFLLLALLHF